MSYDWDIDQLQHFTTVKMSECPKDEEGEWLYIIENAALEARERLECGHHNCSMADMLKLLKRLERKVRTMQHIATLRGYYAWARQTREAALKRPLPDATDFPF